MRRSVSICADYLDLDDVVLDVNVTANRGDAMSMLGLAREVAALAGTGLKSPVHAPPTASASAPAAAGADRGAFWRHRATWRRRVATAGCAAAAMRQHATDAAVDA